MKDLTMEKLKEKLSDRRFAAYVIVNFAVILALVYEFYLFKYGILKSVRYLVVAQALFVIAWIDFKEKHIYNKHLLMLLGIRTVLLVLECIFYPDYWISILTSSLMGMLIGFGIFGLCYLISKGGIGAGDVKLIAVLGMYLGSSVIMPVLIITVIAAAVYCVIGLAMKKMTLKAEMPFGPFVLIGTVISMMLGV